MTDQFPTFSNRHKYFFLAACGLTLIVPALAMVVSSEDFGKSTLIFFLLLGVFISLIAYSGRYGIFRGFVASLIVLIIWILLIVPY